MSENNSINYADSLFSFIGKGQYRVDVEKDSIIYQGFRLATDPPYIGVDEAPLTFDSAPEYPFNFKSYSDFLDYLKKSVKYPIGYKSQNFDKSVIIEFVIEKNGTISHLKIDRGVEDDDINKEVLRVIETLPK